MKLFFAAPLSGLPSDPIGLGSQALRLHLAMKEVRAAPASSRPSFPIALLAHVSGACAAAEPIEKTARNLTFEFLDAESVESAADAEQAAEEEPLHGHNALSASKASD